MEGEWAGGRGEMLAGGGEFRHVNGTVGSLCRVWR